MDVAHKKWVDIQIWVEKFINLYVILFMENGKRKTESDRYGLGKNKEKEKAGNNGKMRRMRDMVLS